MDRHLNYTLIMLCLLVNLVFISCDSKNENNRYYTPSSADTTTLDKTIDSIAMDVIKKEKEAPSTVRVKDLVDVLRSEILFDGNFNPYVLLKLRNNARYSIVGVYFVVNPYVDASSKNLDNENCEIRIKKKVTILPNKTISINEKISSQKNCDYNNALITVKRVVYSNGIQINGWDLLLGDTSLQSRD